MPSSDALPQPPPRRSVVFGSPQGIHVENTQTTIPWLGWTITTRSDVVIPNGPNSQFNIDLGAVGVGRGANVLSVGTVVERVPISSGLSATPPVRPPVLFVPFRTYPGLDP
jgi:hypothetical protein